MRKTLGIEVMLFAFDKQLERIVQYPTSLFSHILDSNYLTFFYQYI